MKKKNGGVKMLMTKRYTRTRSSDQHRLLLLTGTEVKTKAIQSAWKNINCTEFLLKLANKSLLQLYVFCLSTKEKEKKLA